MIFTIASKAKIPVVAEEGQCGGRGGLVWWKRRVNA
jgi:hypothetical protein